MITTLIAATICQAQFFALPDEPDELQTVTIIGSESEGSGVELAIDSRKVCTSTSKSAETQPAVDAKSKWAYVILAPLHGDFMVWVDAVPQQASRPPALGSDDFNSYVNGESGNSQFNVDSLGNSGPY